MSQLKLTSTNTENGFVLLNAADITGKSFQIQLNSMDVASLMGSLRVALDDILQHPSAESVSLPGMKRVQYVETPETIFFRVFLNDHLFHEYPVPRNTTLAADLKEFADRVDARNMAKATHLPHGTEN